MGRGRALGVAEIVDHYYHGNPWAELHLALADDGDTVMGTIGFERIPFLIRGAELPVSFGSNFHTFKDGCGGLLFMKWIRSSAAAMVYNCSADTLRLISAQKWNRLEGIQMLTYNAPATRTPGQSPLGYGVKSLAKRLLHRPSLDIATRKRNISRETGISVVEREGFDEEMLGFESPFDLRVTPDLAYLRWRYATGWKAFRYRIFSIMRQGDPCGFVVLNDAPNQVSVALADAAGPTCLAAGMLLSLAAVSGKRPSLICSSVPEASELLRTIGFRVSATGPRVHFSPKFPLADVAAPLINFGLGDNDIRTEHSLIGSRGL